MTNVKNIDDSQYIKTQYQDSSKLNARIRLHQQFSTNQYGWFPWLFDQIRFPSRGCVLELGCGAGNFWLENQTRIPEGLEIILSDFSKGMLEQTCNKLGEARFQYKVIDVQSIPFNVDHFDTIIAFHMLYHVPDFQRALSEVYRVLKPGGNFYASTVGKKHMFELKSLVKQFDPKLDLWDGIPPDSFTLENGGEQLGKFFSEVKTYTYEDSLCVTDAELLLDYILSCRIEITPGQKIELLRKIELEMAAQGGNFVITKNSGLYICRKLGE